MTSPKLGYRFLPARQEVPPHEDEAKVYRMFFFRVNSSALVGLTDCTNKKTNMLGPMQISYPYMHHLEVVSIMAILVCIFFYLFFQFRVLELYRL